MELFRWVLLGVGLAAIGLIFLYSRGLFPPRINVREWLPKRSAKSPARQEPGFGDDDAPETAIEKYQAYCGQTHT